MEFMAGLPDKAFDLAIVDPPYGINMAMGHKGSEKRGDKNKWKSFAGNDASIPSAEYWEQLFRVSQNQIVWGGNYMLEFLRPGPCFIVWDKVQPEAFSMAMAEFAWTSFDEPAKLFRMRVVGADIDRIHPTQKPVALYRWLLKNYAKPGQRILDTHLGSGSIAIACDLEGFDLVGTEIDTDYIAGARKRLADHQAQPRLFDEPRPPEPEQLSMME